MPANDLMQFSSRDLINLRRWYKKAPRQFASSTGQLLNNFAFGSRLESLAIIHKKMFVRSPGFVRSRIQVKKSSLRLPVSSQYSQMGSVKAEGGRFTGWIEQEYGQKKARSRFAAMAGRGKKKIGKIKRGFRLDKKYPDPDKYPKRRGFKGKNRRQLVAVYLAQLDRMRYNKPFVITGHPNIPSGLYRFGEGRTGWGQRDLEVLQIFGKPKRTRRVQWKLGGTRAYFRGTNLKREWGKVVERNLQKRLR